MNDAVPGRYGHAERLNAPSAEPPKELCQKAHPLLLGVSCGRLRGHPGKHGAEVASGRENVYMEWPASLDPED